ncbi:MAG: DNA adenine methylase [Muribaculaceae bacterium]|nr:DNA adenine methylase [Muribaculaceae bacterium]
MKNLNVNRSPLFYVGDKYKLVSEIKAYFPSTIRQFVEPFVGGGSVYLNVEAENYLLNDINEYVIGIHRMLLSYLGKEKKFFADVENLINLYGLSFSYKEDRVPQALKSQFVKTYFAKYNKEAYAKMRADYNKGNCSDSLLLYLLLIYGFNRMIRFNSKGDFNLPVGNVDFNQNTVNALNSYFRLNSHKRTHWTALDFEDFFKSLNLNEQDLVYLDPPYLITFSEYNKLWNPDTERRLLRLLNTFNTQGIRFAISNVTHYKGKVNDIFIEWSKQYNSHSIKSNYISFHDNTIKQFNEVLVTNF